MSVVFWGVWASTALAQSESRQLEGGETATEYLRVVGRKVDTGVVYYDPTQPAPELTTSATVPRERPEGGPDVLPNRNVVLAISAAVLAIILYQFWRFGAPVSVSLRARAGDAARARGQTSEEMRGAEDAPPAALQDILSMPDRTAALIELARSALSHVASQHDIRWQASWTSRDLLRRLPRDAANGLRPLARAAELAQFGLRPVSEEMFMEHANGIAPLFREGSP